MSCRSDDEPALPVLVSFDISHHYSTSSLTTIALYPCPVSEESPTSMAFIFPSKSAPKHEKLFDLCVLQSCDGSLEHTSKIKSKKSSNQYLLMKYTFSVDHESKGSRQRSLHATLFDFDSLGGSDGENGCVTDMKFYNSEFLTSTLVIKEHHQDTFLYQIFLLQTGLASLWSPYSLVGNLSDPQHLDCTTFISFDGEQQVKMNQPLHHILTNYHTECLPIHSADHKKSSEIPPAIDVAHSKNIFNFSTVSTAQNSGFCDEFGEMAGPRLDSNLVNLTIAVSGSRKLCCVSLTKAKRLYIFDMDTHDDEEDEDEAEEEDEDGDLSMRNMNASDEEYEN